VVKRSFLRLGLAAVAAAALVAGCETLDHARRPRTQDNATAETEEEREANRFFKSSRVSGAMSSEGREIERSLGIQ
jgi:hypothetical protein